MQQQWQFLSRETLSNPISLKPEKKKKKKKKKTHFLKLNSEKTQIKKRREEKMGFFSVAAEVVSVQFPQKSAFQSQRGAFSIRTRTRICFPRRLFFFKMKSAESRVDRLHNLRRVVPSAALTAKEEPNMVPEATFTVEKEAVKNVLALFLRKHGLTNAAASRTVSKSDRFINHLVSRLHLIDKTRYLVGSELPILALEIRDMLVPYLESLLKEHGDILVDMVENYPNPPDNKGPIFQASPTKLPLDSKTLEVSRPLSELQYYEMLPPSPSTLYLLDIGMDLDQIKEVHRKWPRFVNYSLEERIKPLVEFLLDLGMPQSDIPSYIFNAPFCCGFSLYETTLPTLLYLESLGVDKENWLKILKRCPVMFKCKRQKAQRTVDFLYEIGLTTKDIAEVITKCPHIISHSVDNKLRPIAEYFLSLGLDIPYLVCRFPRFFGLSLERNIKPVTKFLLEKGYTIDDIRVMLVKFGNFYCLSLEENLIPKWDYFTTMEYYPRSELVKYPHYFGYSLEGRIRPRYEQMMESDVRLELSHMLGSNDACFEKLLNKRMKPNSNKRKGRPGEWRKGLVPSSGWQDCSSNHLES